MTTILLVEDEARLAEVVARELTTAGFEVDRAGDGVQALRCFERRAPDLVILDWMLPGISGLDVLQRIRTTSAVPVLMLTARGDLMDRVVGLEVGADDYLVKPFDLPELVARVRALLRRDTRIREMLAADHMQGESEIRYETVTLDPKSYTCTLDGAPLDLTRLEFDLLALLLAHPGRTFNRRYLVETVWDSVYVEGDRAVDNTVMRLRAKLGPLAGRLETVRGVGYRMARRGESG